MLPANHMPLSNENTHRIDVPASCHGNRLDKCLATALPTLSRTRLKSLIESGHVAVSGCTINDPAYRVKQTQTLDVFIPEAAPAEPEAQEIALSVIYEDDDLLVIDKPAGMVVHPAPGNADNTMVNALLAHCGSSLSGIGGVKRPGIVHRLDKDTSGLLVVAKNDIAHQGLASQFATRSLSRIYAAFVWGIVSPPRGSIEGDIGRNPADRKKMALVKTGGKNALTHYKTEEIFPPVASLIECRLATGRTHQIRVHMASTGHSLIGDPLYGRPSASLLRGLPGDIKNILTRFPRQALHARHISFIHPSKNEEMNFSSPLPPDLIDLLSLLQGLKSLE